MRTPRFTDTQILAILKQNESGVPVQELCREHAMSSASFLARQVRRYGRVTNASNERT